MANLRRRSTRLSQANASKTPVSNVQLGSLVEREDTPDTSRQTIDGVLTTPTASRTIDAQLSQLHALKTPQTEPRPEQSEMDPKTIHRSTAKVPDSGLKLGFSDITTDKRYDTPSKSAVRPSVSAAPTSFEFKFSAGTQLSKDAQRLMENVSEDASRIKAQMLAERASQNSQGGGGEKLFGAGRRIVQPKGKVGRFSDIHMAQFKKMDSIANHASAFRVRPDFAAPPAQSLKRSPSKADLDALERPKLVRQESTARSERTSPPVIGRPNSVSPFKSIPATQARSVPGATKRARQSEHHDVSDSRPVAVTTARPSSLYSPTKSSLARTSKHMTSPAKSSMIPRSNSTRLAKSPGGVDKIISHAKSPAKQLVDKPLPAIPMQQPELPYPTLPESPTKYPSKLPTLSGLKSILRGGRRTTAVADRPGTPKRPNSVGQGSDSPKKVDFTPSVKSRHAVKLAADSPSPAKIRRDTPYKASASAVPYDSSAYTIIDIEDQDWEDADGEITYPTLPPAEGSNLATQAFQSKSKELNRRESREFKSIFTDLHPGQPNENTSLTSINTRVNTSNPEVHAGRMMRSPRNPSTKPSPSTIRQVRTSGPSQLVQPFEDKVKTVPHGIPAKKRRHDAIHENEMHGTDDDVKENRQLLETSVMPGGWDDTTDEVDVESTTRAGKRTRLSIKSEKPASGNNSVKKVSAAREVAAKNAKERKGRGVLSLSRLNMLSRPKSRG